MNDNRKTFFKLLIGIASLVLLFHLLILLKIIPYETSWGGRLKSDREMYLFEAISISINAFFIWILLQKGNYVQSVFSPKALSIVLWIFFALFALNTIGNMFAKTNFEKAFTVITLVNAILIWKINKTTAR